MGRASAVGLSNPDPDAGALACLPVMGPLYMAWAGLQVAAGVADLVGTGLAVRVSWVWDPDPNALHVMPALCQLRLRVCGVRGPPTAVPGELATT